MPLKGVSCVRGRLSFEEHRRCMAQEAGPPCLIPPTILQIITRHDEERKALGIEFSPSSLSSCHRKHVLQKDNDFYIDVRAAYKPVRGTIFHAGLAQEGPWDGILGVIRELRMFSMVDTVYGERKFWGQPDLVVLSSVAQVGDRTVLHVKLEDYKTKSEVSHELVEAEHEHVVQINMYAWLVKRFLPGWLRSRGSCCPGTYGDNGEMQLAAGVLGIDEVIVDELSITYADMKRTRIFTSRTFLYDEGKIKGEVGSDRRWRRTYPIEHEELELAPIHMFTNSYIESKIRKGIEEQIESEVYLSPPLTGDDANIQCGSCPVRQVCIQLGRDEGYDMADQIKIGAV